MAKRVSSVGIQIEHVPDANTMRLTSEGVNIEYRPNVTTLYLTSIGIMVEYVSIPVPRKYGPAVQIMW